jgi:hypothetical protein
MSRRTLTLAILAAFLAGGIFLVIKSRSRQGGAVEQFLPISADLKPGWQLYSAKDRKPAGLVKEIASNHAFQDGTTQQAVLILFVDATENWLPHKKVTELYVTKP